MKESELNTYLEGGSYFFLVDNAKLIHDTKLQSSFGWLNYSVVTLPL